MVFVEGAGMKGLTKKTAAAFSLAELMIALAILGMGLLVIGRALPAGVQLTKDAADLSTGAAAAEYGLDTVERRLCMRWQITDPLSTDPAAVVRPPTMFQPRLPVNMGDVSQNATPRVAYEPLIKVRPVFTQNVVAGGNSGTVGNPIFNPQLTGYKIWSEEQIAQWFVEAGYGTGLAPNEYDLEWMRPAIPASEIVYPPVQYAEAASERTPAAFFNEPYDFVRWDHAAATETREQVLTRTIGWVSFIRRVSYAEGSRRDLYELIAVAVRRPSTNHRYPVQARNSGGMSSSYGGGGIETSMARTTSGGDVGEGDATQRSITANTPYGYSLIDTAVPVPWLVTFEDWDTTGLQYTTVISGDTTQRTMTQSPGKLVFTAGSDVGPLLPPGSVIIPATNDTRPTAYNTPGTNAVQYAGFVPSLDGPLPIYEVTEAVELTPGGAWEITVGDIGVYPWVSPPEAHDRWPVWVIPPAMEATGNVPQFSKHSPVLGVARRYVTLPEY
jgi:hypothetical protein